jgi:hypothetical protein
MYYESQQKYRAQDGVKHLLKKTGDRARSSCYVALQKGSKVYSEANQERRMAKNTKKIVNIRLRPDQEERINAIVARSAILDTSKFVRIAVDWLLRSDIGEVIKEIVHDEEHFPDYRIPKKTTGQKKRKRSR